MFYLGMMPNRAQVRSPSRPGTEFPVGAVERRRRVEPSAFRCKTRAGTVHCGALWPRQPKKDRMKILITGGAGFIGSAVVRRAVADGWEVVNLDALTYSANLENVASV
ncbi:MAG TPA: NAD-dependent epimerase/dehydratase family protein, partial [Phenylobacterium sp.]|uniref:NAD-dependent epimerase/dehydratase family protein n=1 Tax=Phenylobacterium sp. TaxID=1871053 RepID=UPI002B468644